MRRIPFALALPFALAALLPVSAVAQSWTQRSLAASPPARNSSPAAYDVYRGVSVLFGGYDGTNTPRGDTWEWNGTLWAPRVPTVQPPARWGHGMAFDAKRGRVVMFGGFDGAALRNDTWEWDGTDWQPRTLASAPPVRGYFGMAYDGARGVVVAFGGLGAGSSALGDTWEYDGAAWTQRSTANAPSPRRGAAMTWDEVRRQTVLFGGGNGAQVFGDTWRWDGASWQQATPLTAPPARWQSELAFDGNCGRAVLYGGADAGFTTNYGDAWAWNGTTWSQLTGATPSARHGAAVVHDAQRGQFVCFGGRDAVGFRNDTWELGPSCSRTMSVVAPPVVGQTAQFRYSYPGDAATLHFCWTLVTPRQPLAFPLPIPGLPSIGLCRIDVLNLLLDPAVFLDGSGAQTTALPIPNSPAFVGFQFDVQSVDLDFFTLALRWAGNDVEATVAPAVAPSANFTATPATGSAPLVVQFTDTSTNGPTSWQWDFNNDGTIDSTQRNPSWTYTQNGVYSVRLVATNSAGSGAVLAPNVVIVGAQQPNVALNMTAIVPGTFQMGSTAGQSNEQPVHQVTLTRPFWMGRFEVTQTQYQSVVGSNPSYFQGASAPNASSRPVDQVSWNNAVAYCQALTANEQAAGRVPVGYQYRLPTEAEWEYCCRAGTATEWNTGTSLSTTQANVGGALASGTYPAGQTAVVGSYAPNAFGLYDMHGNVCEWCLDAQAVYASGAVVDPVVTAGANRVSRGGNWNYTLNDSRSAYRYTLSPGSTDAKFGFRVVLAPVISIVIGPNPALNMVPIVPGTFQMGSTAGQSNEQPVHQVTLTRPFWMGRFEVTQTQYQSVVGSNPSYFQGASAPNASSRPVEQVSWNNAVAYCQALTANEQAAGRVPVGYQYRLPTEAEWEYCCRAGTATEWNTGTSLSTSQANFGSALANGTYPYGQTAVVGSYAPNAFGLHDMHGNVWEWCLDTYATYAPGPVTDPFVTGGSNRVIRGGCWGAYVTASICRSAIRGYDAPGGSGNNGGFRVALAPVLVP